MCGSLQSPSSSTRVIPSELRGINTDFQCSPTSATVRMSFLKHLCFCHSSLFSMFLWSQWRCLCYLMLHFMTWHLGVLFVSLCIFSMWLIILYTSLFLWRERVCVLSPDWTMTDKMSIQRDREGYPYKTVPPLTPVFVPRHIQLRHVSIFWVFWWVFPSLVSHLLSLKGPTHFSIIKMNFNLTDIWLHTRSQKGKHSSINPSIRSIFTDNEFHQM